MVMIMDLEPEPIPLNSKLKLWCFWFPLIILNYIDVGVMINDYHRHLGRRGRGIHQIAPPQSCRLCLQ